MSQPEGPSAAPTFYDSDEPFDRWLVWMCDNLAGANAAVYPEGHPKAGTHCVNSGCGLMVCCYMEALGLVLTKGQRHGQHAVKSFIEQYMPDFLDDSSTKALPKIHPQANRTGEGVKWLYEVYRNGFAHQYFPKNAAWTRRDSPHYWLDVPPHIATLNIERLVQGFLAGVGAFANAAEDEVRKDFVTYLVG